MKRIYTLAALLCCIVLGLSAQNAKPFVIPELKEWKGATDTHRLSEEPAGIATHRTDGGRRL